MDRRLPLIKQSVQRLKSLNQLKMENLHKAAVFLWIFLLSWVSTYSPPPVFCGFSIFSKGVLKLFTLQYVFKGSGLSSFLLFFIVPIEFLFLVFISAERLQHLSLSLNWVSLKFTSLLDFKLIWLFHSTPQEVFAEYPNLPKIEVPCFCRDFSLVPNTRATSFAKFW